MYVNSTYKTRTVAITMFLSPSATTADVIVIDRERVVVDVSFTGHEATAAPPVR